MNGGTISKEQMRRIDELYYSPSERAGDVWTLIAQVTAYLLSKDKEAPTQWDLLCFAVEYIGSMALTMGDPPFLEKAMELSRHFYSIHYSNPSEIYGEPDRSQESQDETVPEEGEGGEVLSGSNGDGDLQGGTGDNEEPSPSEEHSSDD